MENVHRSVNRKLIADKFPLPRIDDILDSLGRAQYFSVIDLYSGFHQIPLSEDSRDITAFSTEQGIFRWKVLPFGLNVSPNSFSRMMACAFSGLTPEKLLLYMDDIVVHGKSEKDHLINLEKTFEVCRLRNLKINPEKCQFFRTEVLFLGHVCSANGIQPDPSKFESIRNYPTPHDGDAVRRFVAFANYYRKFIPNFAEISIPLNALTKKTAIFNWSEQCENAFNKLKSILTNPSILAYSDPESEFVLTVDASQLGCGAVLAQNEQPIAFASKSFSQAEKNKSTIEQELIAVHWSIKHFKPYLYGTHFLVRSDHKPLVYLYNLKDPSSKLTRLRLELAEYNFTIEHIAGKNNVVADALSRIHIKDMIDSKIETEKSIKVTTRSMQNKIAEEMRKSGEPTKNETIVVQPPKIMHAYSNAKLKGIPILHINLIENAQGLKLTSSVHKKYKSRKAIFTLDMTMVKDKQFSQLFLIQLEKLANQ